MDARRFEDVSRRVGAARSRRDALRLTIAAVGAALLGTEATHGPAAAAGAEGIPIVHCKIPGQRCNGDRNCCSNKCRNGTCTCSKRGKRCFEPLRGALCCSGRCKNGKCK